MKAFLFFCNSSMQYEITPFEDKDDVTGLARAQEAMRKSYQSYGQTFRINENEPPLKPDESLGSDCGEFSAIFAAEDPYTMTIEMAIWVIVPADMRESV